MCRNRRLGGRRCPLHSSAGFIGTHVARTESGLSAAQVNMAFRVLREEGHNAAPPTLTNWIEYLDEKEEYLDSHHYHGHTVRSMRLHLADAATNLPDGPTYYALKNLDEKTREQNKSLGNVLNRLALRIGATRDDVRANFESMRAEVDTSRSAPGIETYSDRAREIARAAGAPNDVPTIAALERLQTAVDSAEANNTSRISNQVLTPWSDSIYSVGYSLGDDGRLEVTMRNGIDDEGASGTQRTVFAYREVPWETAEILMDSNTEETFFSQNISNNRSYAYNSIAEANGDSQVRRCAECGQFASLQHSCPEGGSAVVTRSARAVSPTNEEVARVRELQNNVDSANTTIEEMKAEVERIQILTYAANTEYNIASDEYWGPHPIDFTEEEKGQLNVQRGRRRDAALDNNNKLVAELDTAKKILSDYQGEIHNVAVREANLIEEASRVPYTAEDLERDIQTHELEFTTENVTNGLCNPDDGMGFGVELEFMIYDESELDAIAQELYDAGLTGSDEVGEYHSSQEDNWQKWSLERDMTVSAELVSRILHDTPEDWEELRKVCEIIESHGGHVSAQTGGHIHMSSSSLGDSVTKHAELINMANEHEDVIYRLGTEPGKTHRTTYWCSPNKDVNDVYRSYGDSLQKDVSINVDSVKSRHGGHNVGMNIADSGNGAKSHVEFRQWDGSLNPAVIQSRILIGAAMVDKASRSNWAEPSTVNQMIPQRPRRAIGYHNNLQSNTTEGSGFNKDEGFLDFQSKVFTNPEARAKVTSLYAVTTWQSNLSSDDETIEEDYEEDYDEDEGYYDHDSDNYF